LPALEAICGWNQESEASSLLSTLHALIGKSLVYAETTPGGEQRFRLLETIREFALEQTQAHGEEALLRQHHYAAYLQLFRTSDSHLRRSEAAIWLARLQPEQDNLRAALQWQIAAASYIDAAWLLLAANYFWYLNGHWYEDARWLAQLLPHRQALPLDLRLAIMVNFVSSARDLAEFPDPYRYKTEMIELMELCSIKQLHAFAWYFLAWSAPDATQTAAILAQALALMRAANEAPELGPEFCIHADPEFGLAAAQWGYAAFLTEQGETAQATPLVTESLQLFRKQGNEVWVGDCLGTLGLLALLRGDLAEAQSHLNEAVTIATTHNLPVTLCEWQPILGIVTLYGGNTSEARRLLEKSLCLCHELKNTAYLARVCMYLAEIALWEGFLEQAVDWLAQSLAYQVTTNRITINELQRLFIAARLATAQQQYPRAAMLWGLAEHLHSQIHHAIAGPMHTLADAALATVQAALEPAVFAEAFVAGQQMALAEAFATMLTPCPTVGMTTKA
jgi:tetratricopeptide (TPR) repeat protein